MFASPTQRRLPIPTEGIPDFCRKWKVTRFELFGSVLRDDFGPDSDVDVIVTFDRMTNPSLFTLMNMQDELEATFGRHVDVLTRYGVERMTNECRRGPILREATIIYAE